MMRDFPPFAVTILFNGISIPPSWARLRSLAERGCDPDL
eukprot:COSAG01_NODE_2900_length_6892_cov_34.502871_6_plen_39_part_00